MHFSKEVIRQAVKDVESGIPRKEVCFKYGMAFATLEQWMKKYGSQDYHDNKRSQFSDIQRRNIVRGLQQGKMTIREASITYKVGQITLGRWLKAAEHESVQVIETPPAALPDARAEQLEKALAEAKLKIRALETLIDVAEEDLKIKIRKKPGAKQ